MEKPSFSRKLTQCSPNSGEIQANSGGVESGGGREIFSDNSGDEGVTFGDNSGGVEGGCLRGKGVFCFGFATN